MSIPAGSFLMPDAQCASVSDGMAMPVVIVLALLLAMQALRAGEPCKAPDLLPVTGRAPIAHDPVAIVQDGVAKAVVFVAVATPSPALQQLLGELTESIRLTSGAKLERVSALPAPEQPAIIIGDCEESRAAGIDAAQLPIEGFTVKTAPNRVYLVGSTQTLPPGSNKWDFWDNDGTAWAVADFLERFVGVRWYWPLEAGGRSVVKSGSIAVPPSQYTDKPAFRMRIHPLNAYTEPWNSTWFAPGGGQPRFPVQADSLAMQPLLTCLRSGNSWPYRIKTHEPQGLWRKDGGKWAVAHKAMFAKKGDGSPNYSMLCYSAPETLQFLLGGCEALWDKKDNGIYPSWVTETCVTVSPFDQAVTCFCPGCRSLLGKPEDLRARASALLTGFVTKLAKEVKQRWPDKKVIFLPYWNYAHCPPGLKLPDNVEIMFANNNAQGMAAMRDAGIGGTANAQIRSWAAAIAGPITTWEYSLTVVGWTHAPVQFPHVVQDYYRGLRTRLMGSFINSGQVCEWSKAAPTMYVWMRVLWNPEIDVDATLDQLCRRQFGAAGRTASRLLSLMCERYEQAPWTGRLGDAGQMSHDVFLSTWPPEVVQTMVDLRNKARRELDDDPEALARLDYWLWTFDAFVKEAEGRMKASAVRQPAGK